MKKKHQAIGISWISPKAQLGKVGNGVGVFAVKKIKMGEVITVFGGFVIDIQQLHKIKNGNNKETVEIIERISYQISDRLIYSPIHKNQFSIAEYLNHSCEPNSGFKGELKLVAMRDIKKGEQIVFDYAMSITSPLLMLRMPCLCGTPSCRKFITAHDWKIKKLQKKYNGYFQPYIQEKIYKLSNSR